MINIRLAEPVYLKGQMKELAKETGMDEKELTALVRAEKSIITDGDNPPKKPDGTPKGKKGDIVRMWDIPGVSTEDAACLKKAEGTFLYGAEGISWLCSELGVSCPEPVREIDIPNFVFYRAKDRQWLSISKFAADVESKSRRMALMNGSRDSLLRPGEKAAVFPTLVLMMEYRKLWEAVETLESNSLVPERWEDGTIMRSLNDVGYSLYDGDLYPPEELEVEEDEPYVEDADDDMEVSA